MKNPQEILTIQIGTMGVYAFLCGLEMAADDNESMRLVRNEDFLIFNTAYEIEKLVFEDKPQLLITGIISGRVEDVSDLVQELRQKNPQLVVVTYSSCRITGSCFDLQIKKMEDGSAGQVLKSVADFRKGILRRK